MLSRILFLPLILPLTGLFAAAMFVPAAHALFAQDHSVAQAFFYSGVIGFFLVTMIGLSLANRSKTDNSDLENLASLALAYIVLPLFLALPFYEGLETTSYINAYMEMVSALTTTGAPLFEANRLSDALHLWRGIVGWLGGLLIWVSASAVLAPLNLGGFEVTARAEPGQGDERFDRFQRANSAKRITRIGQDLIPIYVGLTFLVWLFMVVANEDPVVAAILAMSTLATSGITPLNGLEGLQTGFYGEGVIFFFLAFGLSRLTFSKDTVTSSTSKLRNDPEFRMGLVLVLAVPLLLFSRHWIGSIEFDDSENLVSAASALWGGMFTILSFLTTTGFESTAWADAQDWSGLGTPGLILLGLALVGGGVATTAGGVKLLRVYALYLNGRRELEKLVLPSSMGNAKASSRRIRREGAFIAWVFFMLFALSLAFIAVVLAFLGQDFESAIVLAIAALSTTGPLIDSAASQPIALLDIGTPAKLVLCMAMVLGRLETLGLIALINLRVWRN
ncbi:MAG: potassium transporter TrkG [Pseudomonadota bacterium]